MEKWACYDFVCVETYEGYDICAVSALLHRLPIYLGLLMYFCLRKPCGLKDHVMVLGLFFFFSCLFIQSQPSKAICCSFVYVDIVYTDMLKRLVTS